MPKRPEAVPVIINQGGGSAGDDARNRVAEALKQAGVTARIIVTSGAQTADHAAKLVKKGVPLIVAAGGDGTMSAIAGAIAGSKTAMGLLPLGTLNHLARDLGISFDLKEAAAVLAAGRQRSIDVAEMNGRIFINNSAIGLYPLMVIDRDAQQKRLGRSKRLAMIVATARTLARFRHQRLTLTVNDGKEGVDTPLLFVGNNDYRTDLGAPGQRKSLTDGRLCVLVMRKKTRAGLLAASIRALFNRARDDDMERIEGAERLRVSSRRGHLSVSLDGEVVSAATPLDYRIRKGALRVVAP